MLKESIRAKIEWLLSQPGMDRPTLIAATESKGASTVSEWLRTGRISKQKLLMLAELSGVRAEWWLDPEAKIPPPAEAMATGRRTPPPAAARALFAEEEVLLDDYRALPEGWKFYLRHKAGELAAIARTLPPFVFESFRPLPPDASYWQWEQDLNDYIRQQAKGRNHEAGQER